MPTTTTIARDTVRREAPFGHFTRDHVLFEDFSELPAAAVAASVNKHFTFAGTGTPVVTALTGGGILLSTRTAGTADNDTARVVPAASSAWATTTLPTAFPVFDTVIRTPSTITDAQFYAGMKLTGTNVMATDADQILFLYDTDNTTNFGPAGVGTITASANWLAVYSVAGDDEYFDTGIPVAVSTNYRLTFAIDQDYKARFYIDGVAVVNGTAVLRTPVLTTTAALLSQIGVATRDGAPAVRTLGIRSVRLQHPYQ